jgi:hypothetical protein
MNKMLVIDNEPVFVDPVKAVFKANSFSVFTAGACRGAFEEMKTLKLVNRALVRNTPE